MLSSTVKEVSWVDSFDLPSVFDSRLPFYKEWHDFVFFDRKERMFGLLNFAVHGNPFDALRGYGAALAFLVTPEGEIRTGLTLIPVGDLHVSPYSPDYLSSKVSVSFLPDGSFRITGEIDTISLDLSLQVMQPPVTMNQIGSEILSRNDLTLGMFDVAADMAKVWDKWVELPKLEVLGTVEAGGRTYNIDTVTGYQDHEGGRFDWGSLAGWDTGVLLCDPLNSANEPEKVSFLFYRYGPLGGSDYGGIIVKTPSGNEKYFESDRVSIVRTGEFKGERAFLPGVTRLLYPDYHPKVPEKTTFSAVDASDNVQVSFTPRAVCIIVVASASNDSETVFNEMYCDAELRATVAGEKFGATIPCWFESVRPRGLLKAG